MCTSIFVFLNIKKPPNLTGYSNPVKSDGYPSRILYSVSSAPQPQDAKRAQLACALLCSALLCSALLCSALRSVGLFRMAVKSFSLNILIKRMFENIRMCHMPLIISFIIQYFVTKKDAWISQIDVGDFVNIYLCFPLTKERQILRRRFLKRICFPHQAKAGAFL